MLYELKAVKEPRLLRVPTIEIRKTPRILVDFPAVFQRVDDKRILPERFVGQVNDMGYFGLCVDLPMALPPYSEVSDVARARIRPGWTSSRSMRASCARCRTGIRFRTNLQFTTIDTPGHRRIKQYVDHILWGS
jgi:adenylate cyclase